MTRAVQEGTMADGDAAAGRVRRAFEDAGDGRGAERGGDDNGGAREGELEKFKAKVPQEATRERACRRTCWRTRAVQKETVAVGNTAAGRVRRAFEDAGNGRGAKRAREGAMKIAVQERASWRM
jgi:hypothetical protein